MLYIGELAGIAAKIKSHKCEKCMHANDRVVPVKNLNADMELYITCTVCVCVCVCVHMHTHPNVLDTVQHV